MRKGLIQKSDQSALEVIAEEVILKNEKAVTELRAGKTASLQFLVGQGMKLSKGSANPALLAKIITENFWPREPSASTQDVRRAIFERI